MRRSQHKNSYGEQLSPEKLKKKILPLSLSESSPTVYSCPCKNLHSIRRIQECQNQPSIFYLVDSAQDDLTLELHLYFALATC